MAVSVLATASANGKRITSFIDSGTIAISGVNPILYAFSCGCRKSSTDGTGGSVNWDPAGLNTAFTLVDTNAHATDLPWIKLWRLTGMTGTKPVRFNSSVDKDTWSGGVLGVVLVGGGKSSAPFEDGLQKQASNGTTPSVTVTTGTANDLVIDGLISDNGTPSPGAGQTQTYADTNTNADGEGSEEAGGSSIVMSWSQSAVDFCLTAFNVIQDSGAPPARRIFVT